MSPEFTTHSYGNDPIQFGELTVPDAAPRPGVIVFIHGGFWRAQYGIEGGRAVAADLADRGWVVWNIEYRRVAAGGGWPNTLQDVSDAIDYLGELDVDTSRVTTIGHSAGGHLAVWGAGRSKLPPSAPGASPAVTVTTAISQGGVLDLRTAARTGVGGLAVPDLLGGTEDQWPERYTAADPISHLPLAIPVIAVHTRVDDVVPFSQSEAYVAAAHAAGGSARLVEVPGDHDVHIIPTSDAWRAVLRELETLA